MKKSVVAFVCCMAAGVTLADFQVGFARVDMTPPIGTGLSGYFHERISDGIKDTLDINAVAFSDGTNKAVVISADVISLRAYHDLYRKQAAEAAGLPPEAIFIACTHTHTGPVVGACIYGQTFSTFDKASTYERWASASRTR